MHGERGVTGGERCYCSFLCLRHTDCVAIRATQSWGAGCVCAEMRYHGPTTYVVSQILNRKRTNYDYGRHELSRH